MKFQVLGSGCAKCKTLGQHTEAAAQALGLAYEMEKVTDMNAIIDAGVMSTPALTVNGEIKSMGKVLSVDEIKTLLSA
ncbi:MAG TPA: thioredoxin family protein [Candidatus Competibacteraceae bacterium]|nr:thioredoxin family protein [Candidatus Competibacteraceae bacterium]HRZ08072.1 thioredoxin family protein [Candidatus Competibacteraceae bacterium]HSA47173.1 thioredoxin family protein [Candidatus Competibacteraceae bacterium]